MKSTPSINTSLCPRILVESGKLIFYSFVSYTYVENTMIKISRSHDYISCTLIECAIVAICSFRFFTVTFAILFFEKFGCHQVDFAEMIGKQTSQRHCGVAVAKMQCNLCALTRSCLHTSIANSPCVRISRHLRPFMCRTDEFRDQRDRPLIDVRISFVHGF